MTPKRKPATTRRADARPYVLDADAMNGLAQGQAAVSVEFVLLALAVGFAIGFAVFCIMNVSIWLTSLVFNGLGGLAGMSFRVRWFPLLACTVGGLVIGLWTQATGVRVNTLEEVMHEFRQTGSYRTDGAVKPAVSFLLPLVFGGSVGFEAGLTGLVTAGCCWIRDRLKQAGLRYAAVADVTIAASMSAIFGTPLAGIVAGAESDHPGDGSVTEEPNVDDYAMRRGAKIVLYTTAAFGAFAGIGVFSDLFGAAGGLPRFAEIGAVSVEHLWVIPCMVFAYGMTVIYHASSRAFSHLSARIGDDPAATVAKPVVTKLMSLLIALVSIIILLFLVKILAKAINSLFSFSILKTLNRFLGGVFGAGKGILLSVVFCIIISLAVLVFKNDFGVFTDENVEKTYIFKYIYGLIPFSI